MKSDTYRLIKQAISLMDDYHEGKKDAAAVTGPLQSIYERLKTIEKRDKGNVVGNKYAMQNDGYASCACVYVHSFLVGIEQSPMFAGTTINDTYDTVEKLKNLIK